MHFLDNQTRGFNKKIHQLKSKISLHTRAKQNPFARQTFNVQGKYTLCQAFV